MERLDGRDVWKWGVAEAAGWAAQAGFADLAGALQREGVTGGVLLRHVNLGTLKTDLGIESFARRAQIVDALDALRSRSVVHSQKPISSFFLDQANHGTETQVLSEVAKRIDTDRPPRSPTGRRDSIYERIDAGVPPREPVTFGDRIEDATTACTGRNFVFCRRQHLQHPAAKLFCPVQRLLRRVFSTAQIQPSTKEGEVYAELYVPRKFFREQVDPSESCMRAHLGYADGRKAAVLQHGTYADLCSAASAGPREGHTDQFRAVYGDEFPAVEEDDDDEVLPLYGESDHEGFDSETEREIEKELQEESKRRAANEARLAQKAARLIKREDILKFFDDAIAEFRATWENRRRPKLEERRYFYYWKKRRAGITVPGMAGEVEDLETRRLPQIKMSLASSDYKNEEQLRRCMGSLQETVSLLHDLRWFIELLGGPVPPKHDVITARCAKHSAGIADRDDSDGGDEGGRMSDFIATDDDEEMSAMENNHTIDAQNIEYSSDASMHERALSKCSAAGEDSLPGMHDIASAAESLLGMQDTQALAPERSTAQDFVQGSGEGESDLIVISTSDDDSSSERRESVVREPATPPMQVPSDAISNEPPRSAGHPRSPSLIDSENFQERRSSQSEEPFPPGKSSSSREPSQLRCRRECVVVIENRKRARNVSPSAVHVSDDGDVSDSGVKLSETPFSEGQVRRRLGRRAECQGASTRLLQRRESSKSTYGDSDSDFDVDSDSDSSSDSDDSFELRSWRLETFRKKVTRGRVTKRRKIHDRRAHTIQGLDIRNEQHYQRQRQQQATLASDGVKVAINIGHEDNEQDIYIPYELSSHLKPHQVEGVQFLWKNLVMFKKNGAILAHSMGLGKTLQVIAFIATLMNSIDNAAGIPEHLKPGRVLVLCPPTLVENWVEEFEKWVPRFSQLEAVMGEVRTLRVLRGRRLSVLRSWAASRGTLVVPYHTFRRLLADASKPVPTGIDRAIVKLLLEMPSLVIADEGHVIKNKNTAVSAALKRILTPSRVCLTGYPLQNRLEEYWCMIDWINPGLLGDLQYFTHRFVEPINAGLYHDSTHADRRHSAKKLYVLSKIIRPCVQRHDASILKATLPSKREFVFVCQLTELQRKLYNCLIDDLEYNWTANVKTSHFLGKGLLLQLICNHPYILHAAEKTRKAILMGSSQSSALGLLPNTLQQVGTRAEPIDLDPEPGNSDCDIIILDEEEEVPTAPDQAAVIHRLDTMMSSVADLDATVHSHKVTIMLSILDNAKERQEKVLVFARSIITLDYIEKVICGLRYLYYRMDGKTPMMNRLHMINEFNDEGEFAVFLISAKTGGVGVNLASANRVILFDIGWNPSDDEQAIARVYRYGQEREVSVYRLQTFDTWEHRLFKHNVHKVGLAMRVVDGATVERQIARTELVTYFRRPAEHAECQISNGTGFQDDIVNIVVGSNRDALVNVLAHEGLLSLVDEELDSEERREAEEYLKAENNRIACSQLRP